MTLKSIGTLELPSSVIRPLPGLALCSSSSSSAGLDSDSFASDWTAETDNETDPQYETVILRSTQTDRPTYPKVADLFAVSPPSSPTTSPRPTSDLLTDVEDEDDHVAAAAAATGREVDDDGEEEEEEAEGVLAETADDQAFLIRDEQVRWIVGCDAGTGRGVF